MKKNLLSEKNKDLFEPQIIMRGINEFKNKEIEKCFKIKDNYYISKIYGVSTGKYYTVKVKLLEDDIELSCTCPYQDNCKHEYTTLLAIDNKKYKVLKLLEEINPTIVNFEEFVSTIPAEDLKQYVIKMLKNNYVEINEAELKEYFIKYLPKEDKKYYYNNIYNAILMDDFSIDLINNFINVIRNYTDSKDYNYVFTIFTLIIDGLVDGLKANNINLSSDLLLEIYSKLGVFARISYRKCLLEEKKKFNKWLDKYNKNNYNDDVYLEDLLLTIK